MAECIVVLGSDYQCVPQLEDACTWVGDNEALLQVETVSFALQSR